MDIVDEMLDLLNDAPAALQFIGNALLPAVREFRLLGHVLEVRALYAVVLGYCGNDGEKRRIMGELVTFQASSRLTEQLEDQRALLSALRGERLD